MNSILNKWIALMSPMKIRNVLLVSATLAVGALQPAAGQIIYATGFEAPLLVAGTPLAGQDGWAGGPPFLSNDAATVIASKKGAQTVHVAGADMVRSDFINTITGGYYDAVGSYRHRVDYDTGGTKTVRVSVDIRLDGRETPKSNFFAAGVGAIGYNDEGGSEGIGELAISSDGHVYGYSGQNLVPIFLAVTHVALGKSHNLAIEANFADRTYSFFVDDSWLGTFDFAPTATSNVLRRGSLLTYAAPDTKKDKKEDHSATYDNFAIDVVSESSE